MSKSAIKKELKYIRQMLRDAESAMNTSHKVDWQLVVDSLNEASCAATQAMVVAGTIGQVRLP